MLVRDDILWRQYVSWDEAMKLYRKYIDIHIGKLEKIQYIFITATIVIDVVVSMWELSLVLHVCGTRARSLIAQRILYFSLSPPHSHAKSFCYVTEYTTGNNGSRCQFYLSPIVWSELCCEVSTDVCKGVKHITAVPQTYSRTVRRHTIMLLDIVIQYFVHFDRTRGMYIVKYLLLSIILQSTVICFAPGCEGGAAAEAGRGRAGLV